jgi:hypothetical protein
MEERIIAIQNLSSTPITIEGVLLNQNAIMYASIGFWQTADWRPLTTLTTLKIFLSTGVGYTLSLNPNEYANAFARTANFVEENYLVLLELEKLQAQVITTNSTLTTITEFSLANGVWTIEYLSKAFASSSGNGLGEKNFFTVKVVGNVHSLISGLTQDKKSNFPGSVRTTVDTTPSSVRINAIGQSGVTILWNIRILNRV